MNEKIIQVQKCPYLTLRVFLDIGSFQYQNTDLQLKKILQSITVTFVGQNFSKSQVSGYYPSHSSILYSFIP